MIPERQQLFYNGIKLSSDHKTLEFYNIKAGATIYLKDQGIMVPNRVSKITIYMGPPLIFYLFHLYHTEIFTFTEGPGYIKDSLRFDALIFYEEGLTQHIAKFMIFVHYVKLLLEDIPHNRRAGRMTPLNRTLW